MALWVCSSCSTRYAPGLERCPNCRSVDRAEEGAAGSPGSRLPFLDVVCPTVGCRAEGVVRRIHLPMIVPGVVEQPTYRCVPCGAVMLPVDGWPSLAGMEENMPKITAHGGPSNAAAEREQESDARPPATGGVVENPPAVGEDDQGTGVSTNGVEKPSPEPKTPAKRSSRARKAKPDEGAAELTITAEAEVTRGDSS